MVTPDALSSQKVIAHRVRDAGADYVFALKSNRKALYTEAKTMSE